MGGSSKCGCKDVYIIKKADTRGVGISNIITYPYSSCICFFLQHHHYFLFILKIFFVLVPVLFGNLCNNFSPSV